MTRAASRYKSSHWGKDPKWVKRIDRVDLPAAMQICQMGTFVALEIEDFDGNEFVVDEDAQGHVAFSIDKKQTVFVLASPETRRDLARRKGPYYSAAAVARHAGGRHAGWAPRNLQVKVLGWAAAILYFTDKEGDGPSTYRHEFGEESGVRPIVGIDRVGNIFLLGGNYTVPDAGITD